MLIASLRELILSHHGKEFHLIGKRLVTGEIYRHLNDEAFRKIALGQNYFDLFPGLNKKFQAPAVCHG